MNSKPLKTFCKTHNCPIVTRISRTVSNPDRPFHCCRDNPNCYFKWADNETPPEHSFLQEEPSITPKKKNKRTKQIEIEPRSEYGECPICTSDIIKRTSHTKKNPNREYLICSVDIKHHFQWFDEHSDTREDKQDEVPKCRLHQVDCVRRVSKSQSNPGRVFWTCRKIGSDCYFRWVDKKRKRDDGFSSPNKRRRIY